MAPKRGRGRGKAASVKTTAAPADDVPPAPLSSPLSSVHSPTPTTSQLPLSPFAQFRSQFRASLSDLVKSLKTRRDGGATDPVPESEMVTTVQRLMDNLSGAEATGEAGEEQWRKDIKRGTVDRALEEMLFDLSVHPLEEADLPTTPSSLLCDVLDVILTFSELDYADTTLPLSGISTLLDMQTIAGCHHIFAYIESRVERLTRDMHPLRGKGPLLLRLLNELLRRLPKSAQADVIFSGRILMFLSAVFPLGEKSGVNLRGNFNVGKGTVWEEKEAVAVVPGLEAEVAEAKEETGEEKMEGVAEESPAEKMDEDLKPPAPEPEDFYTTFWSLQRYFSNPPSLFIPVPIPVTTSISAPSRPPSPEIPPKDPFTTLHHGLKETLGVFAEATKKEKILLGAGKEKEGGDKGTGKASEGDGEGEEEEEVLSHYFFPKFLTSRNLLELELADPAFRRQILVQILVLFQYLLGFTPAARAAALALPTTNMAALQGHVLAPENVAWIGELRSQTLAEMGSMERGPHFRQTVELILRREQNWINWKLKACIPFERAPLPEVQSTVARGKLVALTRKPKAYPYPLGNLTLSRLWEKNTRSLEGFVPAPSEESFDTLAREWKMTNRVLAQKRAAIKSSDAASQLSALSSQIEDLEKKSKALHWRALRVASTTHLHLFGRIKAGDLDALIDAMEDDRRKNEGGAADEEEKSLVQLGEGADGSGERGGVEEVKGELGLKVEEVKVEPEVEAESAASELKPEEQGAAPQEVTVPTPVRPSGRARTLPVEPTTPKRPRAEEDVEMVDGEQESKKAKTERADQQ